MEYWLGLLCLENTLRESFFTELFENVIKGLQVLLIKQTKSYIVLVSNERSQGKARVKVGNGS